MKRLYEWCALVPLTAALYLSLGGCTELSDEVSHSSTKGARIEVTHRPVDDPQYQEVHDILQETEVFETIADSFSEELVLPNAIAVNFEECGEENAYYSPDDVTISMCYELIERYKAIFASENLSEDEYTEEVVNAALFTFYHELGHALVDQLNLPITGKEEDVVDEFATVVLLQDNDISGVLSGMYQFALDAEETEASLDQLAFWDEHSFDSQRFYSIACLIYGSDPAEFTDLVTDEELPADRAESCPVEYERKTAAWNALLEPHYREQDDS